MPAAPPETETIAVVDPGLEAASVAALAKARTNLARAGLLARGGDYPGGFSFLVLALEEASKFVFLKGAALGLVTFDRNLSSDHFYVHPHDLTRHPVKHSVFAAGFFFRTLIEAAFRMSELHAESPASLTHEKVLEMIVQSMEEAMEAIPAAGDLDPKKQAAFYSGDRTPSGAPMRSATRADYRRLRRVVTNQVDFLDAFQSFRIPTSTLEETRVSIRKYRGEHGPAPKAGDLAAFDFSRR
jgi:AbiV family abortive infection protein